MLKLRMASGTPYFSLNLRQSFRLSSKGASSYRRIVEHRKGGILEVARVMP